MLSWLIFMFDVSEVGKSLKFKMLKFAVYFAFVLIGVFLMAYVYAFASMVDPKLIPEVRRGVIIRNILLTGSVIPFGVGLVLFVVGLFHTAKSFFCFLGWGLKKIF